jgi:HTH-type transcriptional regulator / antitoxin HigA
MKITIIKSETQYKAYCDALEKLLEKGANSKDVQDEIELLTLLIEK